MLDYYKIFDVDPTATPDEIKRKYYFHVKTWDPDKFYSHEDRIRAEEKLEQINRIYAILSDPIKRKKYDNARLKASKEYQRGKTGLIVVVSVFIVGIVIALGLLFLSSNGLFVFGKKAVPTQAVVVKMPTSTPVINYDVGSVIVSPKDDMTLIYVPDGEFEMGDHIDDGFVPNPAHIIYLDAFWIDETEVTNAMYEKCVAVGACNPPRQPSSNTREWYYGNPEFANYPVLHVSWEDANAYCRWAKRRLPTEAEWEKAAGWDQEKQQNMLYPWGEEFAGSNANFCDLNCSLEGKNESFDDGYIDTAPVKSYMTGESYYGVYDMAGNVWEWVADWYGENYYLESPASNPQGPSFGKYRILRGGAWSSMQGDLTTSFREGNLPNTTDSNLGFRCAKDK